MLDLADLDEVCPDWRERETWACGPAPMLDAVEEHWDHAGRRRAAAPRALLARPRWRRRRGRHGHLRHTGKQVEADGATTLLEAGEQAGVGMPYGCRMGICHTCTLTLVSGPVRDLRNGEEHDQPNENIQTCVTAACGDCTLDI